MDETKILKESKRKAKAEKKRRLKRASEVVPFNFDSYSCWSYLLW
jgi:hypothetical protein